MPICGQSPPLYLVPGNHESTLDLPLEALYVNEIRQYVVFLYLGSSPYHSFFRGSSTLQYVSVVLSFRLFNDILLY